MVTLLSCLYFHPHARWRGGKRRWVKRVTKLTVEGVSATIILRKTFLEIRAMGNGA